MCAWPQGVCFHLYSRVRSEGLADFQTPELQRSPLDELSLQVRAPVLALLVTAPPCMGSLKAHDRAWPGVGLNKGMLSQVSHFLVATGPCWVAVSVAQGGTFVQLPLRRL